MQFEELGLKPYILKAIANAGYTQPTPIQQKAIPIVMQGQDLLGCAQTGTGKTAAFAMPTIQTLWEKYQYQNAANKSIKALIVTPTRELALQIWENFEIYAKYT